LLEGGSIPRILKLLETNPLGIKGCGEAGCAGAMVPNAIIDALPEYGITHIEMPVTSEKVWRAIRAARPSH
jgi:aerobic carbon-monoxide dehydrogenase large subunit